MASRTSKADLMTDWLTDRVFRMALAVLLVLPFDRRRDYSGWFVSRIVAPIAGYRTRIRKNLDLIFPDMPKADVEQLVRAVPDNIGRTLIEMYSSEDFIACIAQSDLTGPGVAALEEAHRNNRPVLLVTGHIGNFDAIRAALIAQGYRVGGLYKTMNNRFFNAHYVNAVEKIGTPLFPRGRDGLADMVRFLKGGGMVGVVLDQHMKNGEPLMFMGKKAMTSLSVGRMALRFDALVVPAYGLRRADGKFDLFIDAPIESGSAIEITQALNDNLEKQVRAHPDQWLWTHRRWRTLTQGATPSKQS